MVILVYGLKLNKIYLVPASVTLNAQTSLVVLIKIVRMHLLIAQLMA